MQHLAFSALAARARCVAVAASAVCLTACASLKVQSNYQPPRSAAIPNTATVAKPFEAWDDFVRRLSQSFSVVRGILCRPEVEIEAGFRKIKQVIGSSDTQTRNPDAVNNHLHFCMAATAITWIYAAHLKQAPVRRYASDNTNAYAFGDVRRALAREIERQGFGIVCHDPGKPDNKSLISVIMRRVG
jgi:hypothetical protein